MYLTVVVCTVKFLILTILHLFPSFICGYRTFFWADFIIYIIVTIFTCSVWFYSILSLNRLLNILLNKFYSKRFIRKCVSLHNLKPCTFRFLLPDAGRYSWSLQKFSKMKYFVKCYILWYYLQILKEKTHQN